jgi:hypothetical protein
MKHKCIFILLFTFTSVIGFAQTMYGSFTKEAELMEAMSNYDYTKLVNSNVLFSYDTLETEVNLADLNALMRKYVILDKNTKIKKAAETNNGYVQTMGLYNKNEDALMYVRFEFSPLDGKLKEVYLEKNR